MNITISDVANRANVSKSTASLALNDRPGVSEETRAAVLRAAVELGYSVRRQPAALAPVPSNRTLLLICQRYPGKPLDNIPRVYAAYITGVRQTLSAGGAELVVMPVAAETVDHSPQDIFLNTIQVDGVLIVGLRSIDDPLLALVKQLRIPYMALGRHWPGAQFSCIGIDDRQALVAMVEYLAGLGHRQLALISEQRIETFMWHHLRLAGFDKGLQRCGLDQCRERVVVAASPEAGVAEILARWPQTSAIVATHDHLAHDVIQALAQQGRAVPDHISVVGYDNIGGLDPRLGDNYFPPNITSVDSRQVEAGRIGADTMLRWIKEPEIHHMQITLQWRLIERCSTQAVAATT